MVAEQAPSGYLSRRQPVAADPDEQASGVSQGDSPKKSSYIGRRAPAPRGAEIGDGDRNLQEEGPLVRKSAYIGRRRCPEESESHAHAWQVGLNVLDFSEDCGGFGMDGVQKRGSIHGEGKRVLCTALDLVKTVDPSASGPSDVALSEAVFLNIYDLGDTSTIQKLNVILKPLGSGAFHAAIQLYGQEWSFGGLADAEEDGEETGIWSCSPQKCTQHTFRESIIVGNTSLSHFEVLSILGEIAPDWPMNSYDLLRRNCCHFCDEFSRLLGLGALPEWVLNLANVGAVLDDGLTKMAHKIRVAMSTVNKLKLGRQKKDTRKLQIASTY